ncbi:hypothetical protein LXL04_034084 [Taraxacum kok-saghyz]
MSFIEVIRFEPGFEHSYFGGEVIGDHDVIFPIQYEDFTVTKDRPHLVEKIQANHVRPYPSHINHDVDAFQKLEIVDVWYKDGWWDGVIHDVFYNMKNYLRYEVCFDYMPTKKQYGDFQPTNVRPHQDWVLVNNERVWVSPLRVKVEEEVIGERSYNMAPTYGIGEYVEVMDLGEGFEDAYFGAVVMETMPGRRKVRYDSLMINDKTTPLEEIVTLRKRRPYPPDVNVKIGLGDIVDARYKVGWCLDRYERKEGGKYVVHFEKEINSEHHMSFSRTDLRIHLEFDPNNPSMWGFLKRYP